MAEDVYHLQDYTTLDISESDGSTTLPIAGIHGATIIPAFTIDHFYSADSVKASAGDSVQYEFLGDIEIEYGKFDQDAALVQQWLDGSGGSTATSLTDTSSPQEFEVTGSFDSKQGDRTLDVTVTGITFEEMPVFDGSEDDFVAWNLSGEFKDITDVSTTDNTV